MARASFFGAFFSSYKHSSRKAYSEHHALMKHVLCSFGPFFSFNNECETFEFLSERPVISVVKDCVVQVRGSSLLGECTRKKALKFFCNP